MDRMFLNDGQEGLEREAQRFARVCPERIPEAAAFEAAHLRTVSFEHQDEPILRDEERSVDVRLALLLVSRFLPQLGRELAQVHAGTAPVTPALRARAVAALTPWIIPLQQMWDYDIPQLQRLRDHAARLREYTDRSIRWLLRTPSFLHEFLRIECERNKPLGLSSSHFEFLLRFCGPDGTQNRSGLLWFHFPTVNLVGPLPVDTLRGRHRVIRFSAAFLA